MSMSVSLGTVLTKNAFYHLSKITHIHSWHMLTFLLSTVTPVCPGYTLFISV